MILSTAYLPNIQYFSKFAAGEPLIEAHENFQKQSYRNRAEIMTADGTLPLTVPVVWNHDQKMPIREVLIDNSVAWQRTHWRTITAAYAASPYFEHYAHRLEPFYTREYRYLWDLNCSLTEELLRIFNLPSELRYTDDYEAEVADDFRNSISPKPRLQRPDSSFTPPLYYQVFGEKIPFVANLSIIDYLFCEGTKL